jgi:RHS repeat-associated protein
LFNERLGHRHDGTGLLFERNRYYSPELHRYISEDPIGLAGGDVNLYARVGNNPVNFVDPLGLDPNNNVLTGC